VVGLCVVPPGERLLTRDAGNLNWRRPRLRGPRSWRPTNDVLPAFLGLQTDTRDAAFAGNCYLRLSNPLL